MTIWSNVLCAWSRKVLLIPRSDKWRPSTLIAQASHINLNIASSTGRSVRHIEKIIENVPAESYRADVKQSRKEHAEWVLADGNPQELIFIDESGYNLWLSRTRCRAPRGQRWVRVVGERARPNLTLVIVVSNTWLIAFNNSRRRGEFGAFQSFSEQHIKFCRPPTTIIVSQYAMPPTCIRSSVVR